MAAERYAFEPLGSQDRAAFSCGNDELDRYLKQRAGQDRRRYIATCFLLVDKDGSAVVGYYTLSACVVVATGLPEALAKKFPRYPDLPGILIGRFAVDLRYQGQGFGRMLLTDALARARETAEHRVGSAFVIVDAKNEEAKGFYEQFGFTPFESSPMRLFLPTAEIPGS